MTTIGSGTFLDIDFKANPGTGGALKKLATTPGPGTPGTPVGLRADGYIEPGQHPPGGLLGGSHEPGPHLASLPNGNFQDGLVGWTQAVSGSGAVAVDPGNSLSGTNALKLSTAAAADSASAASLRVPLAGGVPVYLSVIAKTLSGSPKLSVVVGYFDATGAALSSGATATPIAAFTPGASMTETGVVVTPPAGARFATFTPTSTGAVGVVEVDEVRLDQTMLAKFIAAPAAHRKALGIFTVSVADYCNIGATADHTTAINAAIAAVAAVGTGCVLFPDGFDYFVSSAIRLPGAQAVNIKLKCEGRGARLRRVKGYTGNIFFYDGSTQSNCRITIEDFFFFSDYSADTPPKAAAILMQNGNALQVDILNCLFWDQYAGIDLNAMSEFRITGCRIFHSAGAVAAGFGGYSGLFFTGHCFSGWVSDCRIEGQSPGNPNNLHHCILIQGADGIQFDNIYVWGYFGIHIIGGQGYGVDDVYFTNVVADDCNSRSVLIEGNNAPNAFTNISFTRLHANVHNGSVSANGASSAIVVQGDADNVTFTDVNCGLADAFGVYISGPATNWNGKTKGDIHLNAVVCYDNNPANTANTHGIFVDVPGVHIHGGSSGNRLGTGHQGYGVAATGNAQQLTIVGMDCRGNVNSNGIYIDSGANNTAINVANRTA